MSSKIFGLIIIVFLMALSLLGWYYFEAHVDVAPRAVSRVVGYEQSISVDDESLDQLLFIDWLKEKISKGEQRLRVEVEKFL